MCMLKRECVCVCVCVWERVTRASCASRDRCVTTWPHPQATRHLLSLTPVPFVCAETCIPPPQSLSLSLSLTHTHTHTHTCWPRFVWKEGRLLGCDGARGNRSGGLVASFVLSIHTAVPLKPELHRSFRPLAVLQHGDIAASCRRAYAGHNIPVATDGDVSKYFCCLRPTTTAFLFFFVFSVFFYHIYGLGFTNFTNPAAWIKVSNTHFSKSHIY